MALFMGQLGEMTGNGMRERGDDTQQQAKAQGLCAWDALPGLYYLEPQN